MMKRLVLVAALFVTVCGGSFLVQAQAPMAQPCETSTLSRDTVVADTVQQVPSVPDTTQVVAE